MKNQIIAAKWILPIRPEHLVLEDHALVISDDRIIDILPTLEAKSRYRHHEVSDFNHHVIMPGMINSHTHLAMNLFRGLGDDHTLERWLNDYIWPAETKTVSKEMVYDGTQLALAESIRAGVTCINDHYFYPDAVIKAIEEAGIRGRVSNCIFNFAVPWADDIEQYFRDTIKTIETVDNAHTFAAIGPHSPYTVDDCIMRRVIALSDKHELPIHIHLHETRNEVDGFREKHGLTPLQYYDKNGWLGDHFIAVHMTAADEKDIDILYKHGISVVHCPESNMKLASGIMPSQLLFDKGINIALGTDGAASNNDLSLLGEARSAAFLAKLNYGADKLPAAKALEMVTINGAKALHLDHLIGSLEPGKQADFIAINLYQPETSPVYNPMSQIIYAAASSQITDLWCRGKHIMKNREITTLSLSNILKKQEKWSKIIKSAFAS